MGKRILPYVALLAVLSLLALTPSCRHGYGALWLMADLAGIDLPLPDPRPAVERRAIVFTSSGAVHSGDLYRPQGRIRAGLVLVPGAAAAGKDDHRLVEFATGIGRAGFMVLVPDVESLRELRPSPKAAAPIVAAAEFLRSGSSGLGAARLGIGAFSVAAGPAVLAALEIERAGRLDFLLLVGGYHDLVRTFTHLTTDRIAGRETAAHGAPDARAKWIFALSNARRLTDPVDRETLTMIARRRLENPAAPVDDLLPRLGPPARAVYDLISNRDPARVGALIAQLPAGVRAEFRALDLAARDLSSIDGECILVHGLDDEIIPYRESEALARALTGCRVQLFLLPGLHHVDRELRGADAWGFWRSLRAVLAQRG